ncbi:class I histocompatibility antigen, F10 alpha chain-like [Colossoma macropomum]|uniref:class I histocompatibility antigen, F10 alpha chain-like n=1 Tax=Colossoma macropomum TaxID=42526 RepID=UPI001864F003|nr:class I histocompatibility antigen, F10 alpha chain-like [Colossoma macropomum]
MEHIIKFSIFLAFIVQLASAATHSLDYYFTGVTSGISFSEFTAVGHVDGLQFAYYDSNSKKVILTADWIKNYNDAQHWNLMTQLGQGHEATFKFELPYLMKLFNQTGGIHTWQRMFGCKLHDDGTKTGYSQYGYDGEDFISLDLSTATWTAANDKAVIIKQEWESTTRAKTQKNFLETECIERLQTYVDYGRATLEGKVPPEVSLFQKDSSSRVVCLATGFFLKAMMISWQKNGEDLHEDVELRETLPNLDDTFQKRSILTVSPEELDKHNYTCIIQHSSLEKEIVLHVMNHRAMQKGGARTPSGDEPRQGRRGESHE